MSSKVSGSAEKKRSAADGEQDIRKDVADYYTQPGLLFRAS
jgi:hypothetical protein